MIIHALSETSPAAPDTLPLMENGDLLSQEEFHHRFGLMPETFRADLLGGIVFLSSGLHHQHSKNRLLLGTPIFLYEGCTPGVAATERSTVILSDEDEVHPDLCVRLLPECGGLSRTNDLGDIFGSPELIMEVAASQRSLEFHLKKDRYQRAGVVEYVVLCLEEWRLHWFNLRTGKEMQPDAEGIFRSRTFAGLWINGPAVMAKQPGKLLEVLDQGLATPGYVRFRDRLAKWLTPAMPSDNGSV